jgi:hypothetical protein
LPYLQTAWNEHLTPRRNKHLEISGFEMKDFPLQMKASPIKMKENPMKMKSRLSRLLPMRPSAPTGTPRSRLFVAPPGASPEFPASPHRAMRPIVRVFRQLPVIPDGRIDRLLAVLALARVGRVGPDPAARG